MNNIEYTNLKIIFLFHICQFCQVLRELKRHFQDFDTFREGKKIGFQFIQKAILSIFWFWPDYSNIKAQRIVTI